MSKLPGMEGFLPESEPDVADVWATSRQIAQLYGISKQALQSWRDRGCPCEKQDGQYMYPLADLVQWRRDKDRSEARGDFEMEDGGGKDEWDIEYRKWKAKTARVEYEREIGKLVLRDRVRQDIVRCVNALRHELDAIGKSHGPDVKNDLADAMERFRDQLDAE